MTILKIPVQPKQKIVNKLVLIGNGFDLALGLKTKYEDFLFWYFKNFIVKGLTNIGAILMDRSRHVFHLNEDEMFVFYNESNQFYKEIHIKHFGKYETFDDIKNFLISNVYHFTYHFKSNLLKKIFSESNSGWIDIEKVYFDLLREEINKKDSQIDKLNQELKVLKLLLKEYLLELDYKTIEETKVTNKYISQFTSKVTMTDLIETVDQNEEIITDQIYFLNFNYTSSLTSILNSANASQFGNNKDKIKINQIHGNLDSEDEFLIFGYGDEMDNDYTKIEQLNDNRFFENIKSFKYSETNNYRDLLRFLSAKDYQVIIYGHSCGLSDRLMLNEIFEHENCKSIKIYFYNKEEFINKTMDISRHFKSNKLMRKKIVEFDNSYLIPQLKGLYSENNKN